MHKEIYNKTYLDTQDNIIQNVLQSYQQVPKIFFLTDEQYSTVT